MVSCKGISESLIIGSSVVSPLLLNMNILVGFLCLKSLGRVLDQRVQRSMQAGIPWCSWYSFASQKQEYQEYQAKNAGFGSAF